MAYRQVDAAISAYNATSVSPSNSNVIPTTRALYIGVGGDLAVVMADATAPITFANVPAGIFPIQVKQVYTTGTAASQIIALY
jgi:hypothetical protein